MGSVGLDDKNFSKILVFRKRNVTFQDSQSTCIEAVLKEFRTGTAGVSFLHCKQQALKMYAFLYTVELQTINTVFPGGVTINRILKLATKFDIIGENMNSSMLFLNVSLLITILKSTQLSEQLIYSAEDSCWTSIALTLHSFPWLWDLHEQGCRWDDRIYY